MCQDVALRVGAAAFCRSRGVSPLGRQSAVAGPRGRTTVRRPLLVGAVIRGGERRVGAPGPSGIASSMSCRKEVDSDPASAMASPKV